jgi:hypothetical protein
MIILTLLSLIPKLLGQNDVDTLQRPNKSATKTIKKEYPFLLLDGHTMLNSMRVSTVSFPSAWRYGYRYINENFTGKKRKALNLSFLAIHSIAAVYTHEEGHRSILTAEEIGSISAPIFDKNGVAKVIGVSNATLMKLRKDKLPTYIRLHTGGLESDYLILKDVSSIYAFREDAKSNLLPEILLRNYMIITYHVTSLFPGLQPTIKENSNERENDIVGHDIYGMIKHIHRPLDSFYRYVRYEELSTIEQSYLNKVAWFSLLNLVNPVWLSKKLPNGEILSFGGNYILAPFGDMTELNIWLKSAKLKYLVSIQAFDNNSDSFVKGFGIYSFIKGIDLGKNIKTDIGFHYFKQPQALDFQTDIFDTGFAFESYFKYNLNLKHKIPMSIYGGLKYKSFGFIPGDSYFEKGLYFRFGGSIIL